MASAYDSDGIPGVKLLPRLAVGCLLFAAVMGFGTYFIGRMFIPGAVKSNQEYLKSHPMNDPGKVPAGPRLTR